MTFTIANWGCQQPSLNAGQETITPYGGSPTVENTCNVFTYVSPNDTVATIIASNYFLSMYQDLSVGDIIWGSGTDAAFAVQVTASSSTTVTVASMGLTTSIGTANIVNGAVTTAKIANNAVGSAQLAINMLQYAVVTISAAQWNGMYATPVQLVAAQGANTLIEITNIDLMMTFVSAAYAAGGVVGAQYDSTAHGAGAAASTTEAAADFFATASTTFRLGGGLSTGAPFTTSVNKGVYLSNLTGAFTIGDGTWKAHVFYRVLPTV